jgi:hypothetical protein
VVTLLCEEYVTFGLNTQTATSAKKTSLPHIKTALAVSKWTKHKWEFLFTPGNPKSW